jgi:MFS family permease
MKRFFAFIVATLCLAAAIHAEPQFALPLLTEYFKAQEREQRVGGIVLTSVGAGIAAAGAAGAVWSFSAQPGDFSSPEELMVYRAASVIGAGGGAVVAVVGLSILSRPEERYLERYSFLYNETDMAAQEARAYALMADIAAEAKRARISGAIINLCVPLAHVSVSAAVSAYQDDWDGFGDRLLAGAAWTIPSLVGGIISLVGGKSPAERMLDSYRAMREAY